MPHATKTLLTCTATAIFAGSTQAAITVVEWDLNNTATTEVDVDVLSTSSANITATPIALITNGTGPEPTRDTADFPDDDAYMFTDWTDNGSGDFNDFFEFAATNNTGAAIQLDSMQFDVNLQSQSVDNDGPVAAQLRASIDGFATDNEIILSDNRANWGSLTSIDLTGSAIETWADGQTLTFRWAALGGSNDERHAGLDGTNPALIAVPEPGSLALLGLGGLLVASRRRRA